jgi:hypothetical protein
MPNKSKKPDNDKFQTHIPEPRWQQIASVVLALLFIGFWIWISLR